MYTIETVNEKVRYKDDNERVKITLPKEDFVDLIQISEPPKINWPNDYIKSMKNPIGSKRLVGVAKDAKNAAIIVSDASRGVPTFEILSFILRELAEAGVKKEQVTVVVALGVHRPATQDEMDEIVGEEYAGKLNVVNHDAFNRDELVYIGETSFGTPVEVNRAVYDANIRIAIGKVEPHEFAGFSGGRKSVLPGIASEKTIMVNHRPEMILTHGIGPGVVEGNPVSEDMLESAKMLGLDFVVNMVVNGDGDTIGVFCGDMIESHEKAMGFVRSFCNVTIRERPDIIVTTPGYPLNIDFYQTIKPLITVAPILNEGGVLVVYSECHDGVCSDDLLDAFKGLNSIEEVTEKLAKDYKIQKDHALYLCRLYQQKIRIVAHSPNVSDEEFKTMLIEPAQSPQEALERAYEMINKTNPRVLFYPQSQRTLPVLR